MNAELPVLRPARVELGDLTADSNSVFWRNVTSVAFRENVTGNLPGQATEIRAAWDADELRVLFACIDSNPWATMTERDAPLYNEEVVEVFFDPVGDGESYFEIEVNPLNAVLDLVLRRSRSGYNKDFAWDCEGFRSSVRRTSDGWLAELSIPFQSLVADVPGDGARWRGNFYRIDRPAGLPRELSAWSPTFAGTFHVPVRFGYIEFGK